MQPSGKPIRRTSASKRESERKGSKPGRSKTLAKHSGERRMYMSEGDIPRARHVRAVQRRPGRYPYPTRTRFVRLFEPLHGLIQVPQLCARGKLGSISIVLRGKDR